MWSARGALTRVARDALMCTLAVLLAVLLAGAAAAVAAPAPARMAAAPGAPGALSASTSRARTASARRITEPRGSGSPSPTACSGTVSQPNVDPTNVETMQYVVTDGRTVTDLQQRDTTYRVRADRTGMACTVTSTARSGALPAHQHLHDRPRTRHGADPHPAAPASRCPPGGSTSTCASTRPSAAMGAAAGTTRAPTARPPTRAPCSPGTRTPRPRPSTVITRCRPIPRCARPARSRRPHRLRRARDGLRRLRRRPQRRRPLRQRTDGNVVVTAELRDHAGQWPQRARPWPWPWRERSRPRRRSTGSSRAQLGPVRVERPRDRRGVARSAVPPQDRRVPPRVARLRRRPGSPAPRRDRALAPARQAARPCLLPRRRRRRAARTATSTPRSSPAWHLHPWGQAVPAGNRQDGKAPYFGSYREVFGRDLYEAFTALLVSGDLATARDTARFLLERQQLPDGRLPRNSLVNGRSAPDTGGDQLDETAFPILMAWQSGLAGDRALHRAHSQGGRLPRRPRAVLRGRALGGAGRLLPVDDRGRDRGPRGCRTDRRRPGRRRPLAPVPRDGGPLPAFHQGLDGHDHGPYASGRYFLRLSRTGDPNAAIVYNLGNGSVDADQRSVVDAGFLELTRLGALPANDPDVLGSLPVVDATIARTTPSGRSFYRYGSTQEGSEDGYGDCHVRTRPRARWKASRALAARRQPGLGAPLARALRRARRTAAADRRYRRRGGPAVGHGPVFLRRRACVRAGVENPAVPASPYGTDRTSPRSASRPGIRPAPRRR